MCVSQKVLVISNKNIIELYNRYRYYEPHSARYVSKDPIGLFGGLNNSSYVKNPNQWIDPMGLMAVYSWEDENGSTKFTSSQNEAFNAQKKGFQVKGLDNTSKRNLNISQEKQAEKAKLEQFKKDDAKKRKMTATPNYIPTACTIGSQYICGKEPPSMTPTQINAKNRIELEETSGVSSYGPNDALAWRAAETAKAGKYVADNGVEMYGKVNKPFGAVLAAKKCLYDGEWVECTVFNDKADTFKGYIEDTQKAAKAYDLLNSNKE